MSVAERYLDVALARHFRPVGDAGADVGLVDTWIAAQDFLGAHSVRKQVENQGYPDSVPADARLSEAHVRVDRYAGKQLSSRHDGTVILSLDPYGRFGGCPRDRGIPKMRPAGLPVDCSERSEPRSEVSVAFGHPRRGV